MYIFQNSKEFHIITIVVSNHCLGLVYMVVSFHFISLLFFLEAHIHVIDSDQEEELPRVIFFKNRNL